MADGELPMIEARSGSAEHEQVFENLEFLRVVTMPMQLGEDGQPDPHRMAITITSLATFAGIIFGETIGIGLASDKDKRRAVKMIETNFRTGIDLGKKHVARVAAAASAGVMRQ